MLSATVTTLFWGTKRLPCTICMTHVEGRWAASRAVLHALCHYVICVAGKNNGGGFNLVVSTLTAKPPNLIPRQFFWLYGILMCINQLKNKLIGCTNHSTVSIKYTWCVQTFHAHTPLTIIALKNIWKALRLYKDGYQKITNNSFRNGWLNFYENYYNLTKWYTAASISRGLPENCQEH